MKKVTSVILAVFSIALLFAGSARAADRLDALTQSGVGPNVDGVMDGPTAPCVNCDGDPTDPN